METKFRPNYVIHPGILLKEEITALGLTQKIVAERSGIPKTIINEIIKGKRNISAENAVRLEKVLESPASFWLNAQSRYDETMARLKLNQTNQENQADQPNNLLLTISDKLIFIENIDLLETYNEGKGRKDFLEAA